MIVVTHEAAADLPGCFEALVRSELPPSEVVVVDSASRDDSVRVARAWADRLPLTIMSLSDNVGFAAGMNAGIDGSTSPLVLSLNADARPDPPCLGRLAARMEGHPDLAVGDPGIRRRDAAGRLHRQAQPQLRITAQPHRPAEPDHRRLGGLRGGRQVGDARVVRHVGAAVHESMIPRTCPSRLGGTT